MQRLKTLYKENINGIIGTLLFHILLFTLIILANVRVKNEIQEEEIVIDFSQIEDLEEEKPALTEKQEEITTPSAQDRLFSSAKSNQAVNDASKKDPFFDESYQRELAEAKKLVADVNKQLSQKIPDIKQFEMPEQTTEDMDPKKISNTIYSGESNIHYSLNDRYHLRLPIPVYLARGGGKITVDIWVDRSGKVIKATLQPYSNISDPMLPEYAIQAAQRTRFNASPTADNPQKGTITYTFVAQ